MRALFIPISFLLVVSACATKRTPLLQSQIDQIAAERAHIAYRGPGAGPELSEAEYARQHPPALAFRAPVPQSPEKIAEYTSMVRDAMRDPDSVRFRNLKMARALNGNDALYGKINAKNGYGGYTGFVEFCGYKEGERVYVPTARDLNALAVRQACGL